MFQINITLNNKRKTTLFVYGDKTILSELENNQVFINHNCKEGYCGSCILQLIDGEIRQKDSLIHLSPDEFLACCSYPLSDIEIKEKDI